MASTHGMPRAMLSIWICIFSLGMASAQVIGPTNDSNTLPPPGSPQLMLKTSQTSMVSMVDVAPLNPAAGSQATLQQLQVSPSPLYLGITVTVVRLADRWIDRTSMSLAPLS